MKQLFVHITLGLALGFGLAACKKPAEQPAAGAAAPAQVKTYPIQGVLLGSKDGGKIVILKHEAIPGLMQAMTMGFEMADPGQIKSLKNGDKVEGTLEVSPDRFLLRELKKAK